MRPQRGLPLALAFVAVACAFAMPLVVRDLVDAYGRRAIERGDYVEVSRQVVTIGPDVAQFVGFAHPFGNVLVRIPTTEVENDVPRTLLVARDDPTDWRLPRDRVTPDREWAVLVAVVALGTVALLAAASQGAIRPRLAAVAGALLVAYGVPLATDTERVTVTTVFAPGVVVTDETGVYSVRFPDRRTNGATTRPLTGREADRANEPGAPLEVTYRVPPAAGVHSAAAGWLAATAAWALGLALLAYAAFSRVRREQ